MVEDKELTKEVTEEFENGKGSDEPEENKEVTK